MNASVHEHDLTPGYEVASTISGVQLTSSTPMKQVQRRLYTCNWCTYNTYSRSSLGRHTSSNHTTKLQCGMCTQSFFGKYDLSCHIRSRHEGHVWLCDICSKQFTTRQGLWQHTKVAHEHCVRYTCKKCNKGFHQKQHYIGHKNAHLNEKPYVCSICSKSFTLRHNMLQHERMCGNNATVYKCDECQASFARKCNLTDHLKFVHANAAPQLCHCGKAYKWPKSLRRHKKVCVFRE